MKYASTRSPEKSHIMANLGREYKNGEVIVRQGEPGNCMFVIQSGNVEAIAETDGREMRLRTLGTNDFFGEMALFESAAYMRTRRWLSASCRRCRIVSAI
jgi:CRP-like cAMP-binding protein